MMQFYHLSGVFTTLSICVIFLAPFPPINAAVPPLTQNLDNNKTFLLPGISSIQPPSLLNISTVVGDGYRRHCAMPPKWFSPGFDVQDCRSAVEYFYITEVTTSAAKTLEFMAQGARKTTRRKGQPTPRKYTFRKIASQRTTLNTSKKEHRDLL